MQTWNLPQRCGQRTAGKGGLSGVGQPQIDCQANIQDGDKQMKRTLSDTLHALLGQFYARCAFVLPAMKDECARVTMPFAAKLKLLVLNLQLPENQRAQAGNADPKVPARQAVQAMPYNKKPHG